MIEENRFGNGLPGFISYLFSTPVTDAKNLTDMSGPYPTGPGVLCGEKCTVGDLAATATTVIPAVKLSTIVVTAERVGAKAAKGAGDLTRAEVRQIQGVVNEAGRPLEVIGSAATGTRRNVGTNLPLGKGPGKRSDIDYVVPPSSLQHFEGLQGKLPSIDPKTGIIPGVGNPNIGPSIRFEPK